MQTPNLQGAGELQMESSGVLTQAMATKKNKKKKKLSAKEKALVFRIIILNFSFMHLIVYKTMV